MPEHSMSGLDDVASSAAGVEVLRLPVGYWNFVSYEGEANLVLVCPDTKFWRVACGCSRKFGVHVVAVLVIRAILFEIYTRALDFWKLP